MKQTKNKINKRSKKFDTFERFIILCVKWLSKYLCKVPNKDLTLTLKIWEKIILVLKTRGITECIKYTKRIRLEFQKLIFSSSPDFLFDDLLKRNSSRILKPLIERIETTKSYPLIRLALSILFATRSLRLEIKPSFKTIEDGPTYKYEDATFLIPMIYKFLKVNGINRNQIGRRLRRLNFTEYQMSSKSGPNGHALWSSYIDYLALTKRQLECIEEVGGQKLMELSYKFHKLSQIIPSFFTDVSSPRKGATITRKITCISDKEGKTREVAILDYWSQSALYPLHKYQLWFLSRIRQDCTMNQKKEFNWLKAQKGNSYWSIDLTAATDRFPMMIQHQFLAIWFGAKYADAWRDLMVGTPFIYKGRELVYKTGNPMGAYSSFNTFAICHHFIVFLACEKASVNWKRCPYMLLGDDIVIANDRVAKEYIQLLEEWGVSVSLQKTHTSECGFEFAKQIRLHGKNVSHFPLSALYDRRSETFTSAGIIATEVWSKDWNADIFAVIHNYFIDVLRWPRPRLRAFKPKLDLSLGILGFLKGQHNLGSSLMRYVTVKTGHEFCMDKYQLELYSKFLCLHVVHKLFCASQNRVITGGKRKKPLGQLAVDLVTIITSLDETAMGECFDYIEATPFLQIYGRAEETWLGLRSDLSIYQLGESITKFKGIFDKVDIPGSDEDFYTRHRDVVMIQASKSAELLSEMIFEISEVRDDRVDLFIEIPWKSFIKKDKSEEYKIKEID